MNKIENYFEVFLIIFLFGLFLYMIKSYITALLFASVLVFLSYKPFKRLVTLSKSKSFSAFFILLLIMLILIFPVYWLISSLLSESSSIIEGGKTLLNAYEFTNCDFSDHICTFLNENIGSITNSVNSLSITLKNYFLNSMFEIFDSFTTFFVNLFVFLLAFFFLLRDGDRFINYAKKIVPMKMSYKNALFIKFKDVLVAVFFNTLFLAVLQGFLVGVGFWVIGIQSPAFWGIIASFCALLPIFGPAIVWLPVVIYLLLIGDFIMGIGLLIYGLILVSLIDNIVRPLFLTKKLEVHEFLVLLSVLGGIQVFGFFLGLFLGPMIISFLISILNLYRLNFK